MKRLLKLFMMSALLPVYASDLHSPRMWTQKASGKKVKAVYVSQEPGKDLVIFQANGKKFTVRISSLSAGDQTYLKELSAKQAAAAVPKKEVKRGGK